jgi:hypothetical protein
MSKGKWKFAQREVARILKAVAAAGLEARYSLEFRRDGTIVLVPGGQEPTAAVSDNPWDRALLHAAH